MQLWLFMHRLPSIRLVKCEYCSQEFNLDKEDYASLQVSDSSRTGRIKRRSYAHLECRNQKILSDGFARDIKEQRANIWISVDVLKHVVRVELACPCHLAHPFLPSSLLRTEGVLSRSFRLDSGNHIIVHRAINFASPKRHDLPTLMLVSATPAGGTTSGLSL
jgi:hypothetical protein